MLHGLVVPRRDYVWIHDYHLLVLPSLLRMHIEDVRCAFFLHSPFPSSEIFRTFPKRVDILRSLLNADLIGACLLLRPFYIPSHFCTLQGFKPSTTRVISCRAA